VIFVNVVKRHRNVDVVNIKNNCSEIVPVCVLVISGGRLSARIVCRSEAIRSGQISTLSFYFSAL
jgi:hypothetical protein